MFVSWVIRDLARPSHRIVSPKSLPSWIAMFQEGQKAQFPKQDVRERDR